MTDQKYNQHCYENNKYKFSDYGWQVIGMMAGFSLVISLVG
jgi:hypothetical protein